MRLGLHMGYWGAEPVDVLPLVKEAERLGFDSVWSAEAYGSDAVTTLTWVAARTERIGLGTAVMQIPARTPAATAMTAITLDHLSGGRFRLGLGMSGPQVAEGWHGVSYRAPLVLTREYVDVVRAILRREGPVEYGGLHYRLPLPAGEGVGLGKPLKTIVHPLRPDLPIYLAAIGPRNVALAAEVADGWLPVFLSPERMDVFRPSLEDGWSRAGKGPDGDGFDVAPMVPVVVGEDAQACRDLLKPFLALYLGGMGAPGRNFYLDLADRLGYGGPGRRVQELYLEGRKGEAAGAVPDALVDGVAPAGPADRIRDRLGAWNSSGVTMLIASTLQPDALHVLAESVG